MQYFNVKFTLPCDPFLHDVELHGIGGLIFDSEWKKFRKEFPNASVHDAVCTYDSDPSMIDDW